MASVSKDSLLVDRQMKLDRQKQILEQKRRIRQQQVHSGMVIASGIGSRPTSARSNHRASLNISSASSTVITSSIPVSSDTISSSVVLQADVTTISVHPILPNTSEPGDCNREMLTTEKDKENDGKELLTAPISMEEEQVLHQSNVQSLSEKLTLMGLSSAVGGYQSDSSEGEEILEEQTDIYLSSPGVSPLHEASILPQEPIEDQSPSKVNDNPLDINFNGEIIIDDLSEIVYKVPKENRTVKCRIIRDKQGLDKHMYPIYYLYMEQENNKKLFLLAGRKKKRARSSYYIISTDSVDLSRNGKNFVAKLRSNFVGTSFTVYDNGCKIPTDNVDALREELALVNYETNVLGFKGPRKMSVVIPSLDTDSHRICVRPTRESDTLFERLKNSQMSHLIQLYNKQPVWSGDTQAYVLNFHGRVTQASVKNFQLVHSSNEDYVVVQFGRIAEDTFTLDYQFPVCAIQAFAIALSSFDSKWACE